MSVIGLCFSSLVINMININLAILSMGIQSFVADSPKVGHMIML